MKIFKWHAHFAFNMFLTRAEGFVTPKRVDVEKHLADLAALQRICKTVKRVFDGQFIPFTVTELDTGFFSLSVDTPQRRYVVTEPSLNELADATEDSLENLVQPFSK